MAAQNTTEAPERTDAEILHEVRFLMEHKTDHFSQDGLVKNIQRALDGAVFSDTWGVNPFES